MPRTNEAFSRVHIAAQPNDQGWDVLNTNAVRFEERCRSVLGIVGQESEAITKTVAVYQSLLARTFNSNQVTEDAAEGVAFA